MRPWDKQEGEPDKAFGGFEAYCEASKFERTSREIAEVCGVSHPTILDWSEKYNWAERVAAWDSAVLQATHELTLEHQRQRVHTRLEHRLQLEEIASAALLKHAHVLSEIVGSVMSSDNHKIAALKELRALSHIDDLDLTKQITKEDETEALALAFSQLLQKLSDEDASTVRAIVEGQFKSEDDE